MTYVNSASPSVSAAAILAAGIDSATLGILALAGDAFASINKLLNFYTPSGALSGVSTVAVIEWLVQIS